MQNPPVPPYSAPQPVILAVSLQEAKAITMAKAVREQIGPSQSEFARLLHVSVKTLQNWEQRRRNPTGPAAALLKIMSTAPEVALKSLHA
jgi:DNA-binding transcriptional regulator YiaG